MTAHLWSRLTREEIAGIAPSSVTVLPVAATEQHGPHLATGADTVILDAILDQALALTRADVLRAPTLWCGASDHHLPFGGTLSLTTATLRLVLEDLIRSAAGAGATRAFLLNGHGGNDATCRVVASEASRAHGIVVGSASYWNLAPPPADVNAPGHAGRFESSVVAAVDGSLARPERAQPSPAAPRTQPAGLAVDRPGDWQRIDGFTDDPSAATAELGAALISHYAAAVAAAIDALATDDEEDT